MTMYILRTRRDHSTVVLARRDLRIMAEIALVLGALSSAVRAQSETLSEEAQQQAQLRVMKDAAQALQIKPVGEQDIGALSFRDRPILRYSDAARGMPDATVWRLGKDGRPGALVALEIRKKQNQHILNYEFLALAGAPFELSSGPFTWTPTVGMLQWKPLTDGPKPAGKEALRLSQMRMLSQRFSAFELYQGERSKLRMLTQPIDRYTPSNRPNADGAIFAFVYGTNPEVVLFLETDGATWSSAAGRLSSAASWLMLDDKEVWEQENVLPPLVNEPNQPYMSNRHSVSLTSAEANP
jgi:hypothetical protein